MTRELTHVQGVTPFQKTRPAFFSIDEKGELKQNSLGPLNQTFWRETSKDEGKYYWILLTIEHT